MHILLIEPDKVLASTYCQALERANHTVSVAHEAQVAVDVADSHSPELVILELQLIGHNGIEFLHEFRSYPEWQGVPIIVHTWVLLGAQTVEGMQRKLGVASYHYKPQTSLRRLLASVNEVATPIA
jgi:DNA-binding response OmpR family regulator